MKITQDNLDEIITLSSLADIPYFLAAIRLGYADTDMSVREWDNIRQKLVIRKNQLQSDIEDDH